MLRRMLRKIDASPLPLPPNGRRDAWFTISEQEIAFCFFVNNQDYTKVIIILTKNFKLLVLK